MSSEIYKGKHVLIVEDNPLALWTGKICLEQMGCHVSEATSCFEAEDLWKTRHFDLIIMDYRLPDGFGVDIVARMRALGRKNKVIYLTAETENIGQDKCDELGITAVLNKPLNIARLKEVIIGIAEKTDVDAGLNGLKTGRAGKNTESEHKQSGKQARKLLSDSERKAVLNSVIERA